MTLSAYSQLKQQIVFNVGTSERHSQLLSTLKELFRDDINSPRRFEHINTIGQLLKVLEIRDVLSEDNVAPLKEIARRLPNNNELMRKIGEYEISHVNREYVNYYALESNQNTSHREPAEALLNTSQYTSVMSKRKKQRINEAITEEIGTFWRDLGRNLKIRECVIDEIDKNNITLHSKALKLLEVYEYKADPQRWFFVLCEALERTRRKDLSKNLQEIMTMSL